MNGTQLRRIILPQRLRQWLVHAYNHLFPAGGGHKTQAKDHYGEDTQ